MSMTMSATVRTFPNQFAERFSCEGCLDQSASTSYGSQFAAGYFRPVQSQFAGFRASCWGSGSSEKGFSGRNSAGQGTFNAQGAFSALGLDWDREAKRRGIGRCDEEARARLLGFRQPVVSLRTGCNGAVRDTSVHTGTGAIGTRAGSAGFREGSGGARTGLGGPQKELDVLRRVWTAPGDAAGRARTHFRPLAWSKSNKVATPSDEKIDVDEEIDLDSLDLTDEKSSDIIRAAKIAQLEQMDYEELKSLPRRERLIPKKRSQGRKNPFFRLGDPKKLEMIRDTMRPKSKRHENDSDDEGAASEEEEAARAEQGIENSLAVLLQKDNLDVDPLNSRKRKKFSAVTGQYAADKIAELKKAGLLPKKGKRQEAIEDKMRARPKSQQTRKSVLAEHFAAHQGSAQAMIRKVMRMWEDGELKPEVRGPRQDEDAPADVEYGLSYDDSRLHVPFRFGPHDAFQEMLALRPEERPNFFHQGFLDALELESGVAKLDAFKEEFYKTLIKRAQAVNKYCETLSDSDFGIDSSSLDMAVYLTRFLTRNYKNPEDITAIQLSVEDRIDFLQERLHITREMAVALLISYPRYFSPFCDLERRVDGVLTVLDRLDYDKESMIKLVFKNPSIFNNPLQRIADNIRVLQAFGLAEPEFATKVPWLIGMNLMQRLAERVILLRRYGISDAEMPVCFQRNLFLFLTTVDTCDRRLSYMQDLGRGKDWLRELVVSRPKIVCCHLERQVKRLRDSLKKVGLERPDDELVDLIVVNSPLYQMSSKKLDEGLAYFTKELGLSPEIFLEFPQAVGYSLEGRTRPRVKICQSLGLVIADRGQPGLSLAQILVTTFPTFKYCIESGVWMRKYGGHVKQLEYDETGKVLAGLAEAEADYIDDDSVEVEIDLPEISRQG